jgi:hypothetical protein
MSFEVKYSPLCEVKILHQYYLNFFDGKDEKPFILDVKKQLDTHKLLLEKYQLSKFISIQPAPDSLEIMRKHKVKFQSTALGFKLLVQVVDDKIKHPFLEDFRLRFYLSLSTHYFYDFTDIGGSHSMQGQLFYFNNLGNAKDVLHEKPFTVAKDQILFAVNYFTVPVQRPCGLELKSNFFGSTEKIFVPIDDKKKPSEFIQLNLGGLSFGKYQVSGINDAKNQNVRAFYFDPSLAQSGAIGLIELFDQKAAKDKRLMDIQGKPESKVFYIRFQRRETTRRYFLKDGKNPAKELNDIPLIHYPKKEDNWPNPSIETQHTAQEGYSDIYL